MWYVVEKVIGDRASKQDFKAMITTWMNEHKAHKHAASYNTNLKGILEETEAPWRLTRFIEVLSDTQATSVIAKVSVKADGIDLAEVVKHSERADGGMKALMAWAATRTNGNVTITAAYVALVKVYVGYGFIPVDTLALTNPVEGEVSMVPSRPNFLSLPGHAQVNIEMKMAASLRDGYRSAYREGVYWEELPDLIGLD